MQTGQVPGIFILNPDKPIESDASESLLKERINKLTNVFSNRVTLTPSLIKNLKELSATIIHTFAEFEQHKASKDVQQRFSSAEILNGVVSLSTQAEELMASLNEQVLKNTDKDDTLEKNVKQFNEQVADVQKMINKMIEFTPLDLSTEAQRSFCVNIFSDLGKKQDIKSLMKSYDSRVGEINKIIADWNNVKRLSLLINSEMSAMTERAMISSLFSKFNEEFTLVTAKITEFIDAIQASVKDCEQSDEDSEKLDEKEIECLELISNWEKLEQSFTSTIKEHESRPKGGPESLNQFFLGKDGCAVAKNSFIELSNQRKINEKKFKHLSLMTNLKLNREIISSLTLSMKKMMDLGRLANIHQKISTLGEDLKNKSEEKIDKEALSSSIFIGTDFQPSHKLGFSERFDRINARLAEIYARASKEELIETPYFISEVEFKLYNEIHKKVENYHSSLKGMFPLVLSKLKEKFSGAVQQLNLLKTTLTNCRDIEVEDVRDFRPYSMFSSLTLESFVTLPACLDKNDWY